MQPTATVKEADGRSIYHCLPSINKAFYFTYKRFHVPNQTNQYQYDRHQCFTGRHTCCDFQWCGKLGISQLAGDILSESVWFGAGCVRSCTCWYFANWRHHRRSWRGFVWWLACKERRSSNSYSRCITIWYVEFDRCANQKKQHLFYQNWPQVQFQRRLQISFIAVRYESDFKPFSLVPHWNSPHAESKALDRSWCSHACTAV